MKTSKLIKSLIAYYIKCGDLEVAINLREDVDYKNEYFYDDIEKVSVEKVRPDEIKLVLE